MYKHNDEPVARVDGINLRDMRYGCDFEIENDGEPKPEVSDPEKVYSYEELQPYCLLDALESQDDFDASLPFEIFRKGMVSIHPENKIFKKVERKGAGADVKFNDIVHYHYAFYVEYQEHPMDISYLRRKRPERIQIGKPGVITGIHLALQTMKAGELSHFLIHPDLAFGKLGCAPRIPKNATILARLEVFDIQLPDDSDDDDTKQFTLERALKLAGKCHADAKYDFERNNISAAINKYNKAAQILLDARLVNATENTKVNELLCKTYSNLAVCHSKYNNYKKILVVASDAFRDCPELVSKNSKLLYHNGKALRISGDYQLAYNRLTEAADLDPVNAEIRDEMKQLNKAMKAYSDHEKGMCSRMFSFSKDKNNSKAEDEEYVSAKFEDWKQNLKCFIDSVESSVTIPNESSEEASIISKLCSQLNLNCVMDPVHKVVIVSKCK